MVKKGMLLHLTADHACKIWFLLSPGPATGVFPASDPSVAGVSERVCPKLGPGVPRKCPAGSPWAPFDPGSLECPHKMSRESPDPALPISLYFMAGNFQHCKWLIHFVAEAFQSALKSRHIRVWFLRLIGGPNQPQRILESATRILESALNIVSVSVGVSLSASVRARECVCVCVCLLSYCCA